MSVRIPTGSKVLTGAPAHPLDKAVVEAIAEIVVRTPGITEAHLPMCLIEHMMITPQLTLVVGIGDSTTCEGAMDTLNIAVQRVLPTGVHLNIWPLTTGDPILKAVRAAKCQVFQS